MLFNSYEFLIFAPIALVGHLLLRGSGMRWWLIVASYIFYGWANPWYCLLLFFSTITDFWIGGRLYLSQKQSMRKLLLFLSLFVNLGFLVVFKYSGFITENILAIISSLFGVDTSSVDIWRPILPVGISFYTFQTLSYTIDIYRGKLQPARSFSNFALYVAFFPQLVAGPIERASHLLRQLEDKMKRTADDVLFGMTRVLWGLSKKIVFADWMALYVENVYSRYLEVSSLELLLASYAFALQIYLDFSAYSDIAIGLARMMGINIQENFKYPYFSRNISEFWNRWHISLSSWLRDYLYFALGGSRKGIARTVVNVILVMFLGGLWHGAAWTYVIWGLWLGVAIAIYHLFSTIIGSNVKFDTPFKVSQIPSVILTFHVVLVSWVFFRSESLGSAIYILKKLSYEWIPYSGKVFDQKYLAIVVGVAVLGFLLHAFKRFSQIDFEKIAKSPIVLGAFWAILVAFILTCHAASGSKFIYFQF